MKELYLYQSLAVMITALGAIALVIFAFRRYHGVFASPVLFYGYFLCGTLAYIVDALRQAWRFDPNYQISAFALIICNILLLNAITRVRIKWLRLIILAHLLLIGFSLYLKDLHKFLPYFSGYLAVWYSYLLWLVVKLGRRENNIGLTITALALATVVVSSPIVIYLTLYAARPVAAFILLSVSLASAFMLAGVGILATFLISQHQRLRSEASEDPLTGLANRRGMYQKIAHLQYLAADCKEALIAIALDIDHFKTINDLYGHDAGDKVIQAVAKLLLLQARNDDLACRQGGEEFVLIIHAPRREEGEKVAERLRQSIADLAVNYDNKIIRCTVSAGIAMQSEQFEIDALLKAADKALYRAKQDGRNCIRVEALV